MLAEKHWRICLFKICIKSRQIDKKEPEEGFQFAKAKLTREVLLACLQAKHGNEWNETKCRIILKGNEGILNISRCNFERLPNWQVCVRFNGNQKPFVWL